MNLIERKNKNDEINVGIYVDNIEMDNNNEIIRYVHV